MPTLSPEEHLDLLRPICRNFVRSLSADLDELLAETWLATRDISSPSGIRWKAKRRLIDLKRQRHRWHKMLRTYAELSQTSSELGPEGPETTFLLDSIVGRAKLTELERDLLYRRYYRDMNVLEIARSLGRRTADVGLSLRRIESKLRDVAQGDT